MTIYNIYVDNFDINADIDTDNDDVIYRYYVDEMSGTAYFQDILTAETLEDAVAKMNGAYIAYYGKEWWIAYIVKEEVDEVGNWISSEETNEYIIMHNFER